MTITKKGKRLHKILLSINSIWFYLLVGVLERKHRISLCYMQRRLIGFPGEAPPSTADTRRLCPKHGIGSVFLDRSCFYWKLCSHRWTLRWLDCACNTSNETRLVSHCGVDFSFRIDILRTTPPPPPPRPVFASYQLGNQYILYRIERWLFKNFPILR